VEGRRLRVLVDPPGLEGDLQRALDRWVVPGTESDEIGYLVQPGDERSALTVVLDRGGLFLVRQRRSADAIRDFVSLIESLLPPVPNALGLQVRAVATGDDLAVGALGKLQQVSNAYREIERKGGTLLPTQRTWIGEDCRELGTGRRIVRFALPTDPIQLAPNWGEGVASLAATIVNGGDEQLALERAVELVDRLELAGVTGNKPADYSKALVLDANRTE
jgi:hypothetical protein